MLDVSNQALEELLNRLKNSVDPVEIRRLASKLEKLVFRKQTPNPDRQEGDRGEERHQRHRSDS